MKASEAKLLNLLKKSPQFIIPIYQRTYSWTAKECAQLLDDIIRSGGNAAVPGHFLGSVVYIEQGLNQATIQSPLLVIDGQQRLTTVSLLLEALARQVGEREPVPGFTARKLRNYYLLNPEESGDLHYKLLLTQTDGNSLLALVRQHPMPSDHSVRIYDNFGYFEERIRALGDDLDTLCHGLDKLLIVDIALDRSVDNPQLIFESMNSTGRELSQADLIRNYVLMDLPPGHQSDLYRQHWRPMEVLFGQEAYGTHFDGFMRHYLTFKTGEIPNVGAVYEAFKGYARSDRAGGIDNLIADLHDFAEYYCAMALGLETDEWLAVAFADLRELKVDVAYPFLLETYRDYRKHDLAKADFLAIVRLVEAYVFRRAVCSIPTNTLNKMFATLGRSLRKDRYLESAYAALLNLQTYRRFPNDDEFRQQIQVRDVYNFRSRSYMLRRLENYDRKEPVSVDEYTIEHILPQNERLSAEWRDELGPEWQRIRQTWLHTLGNLTLTGYNSEYGDRPFTRKRDMTGGFRESPLHLNTGLGQLDQFDEAAIQERAGRLAGLAGEIWVIPKLSTSDLYAYRPKSTDQGGYSIQDNPDLAIGAPMRPLFEALRREILALDPSVTEEVMKVYVAFKAETNFVDIIPQKQQLLLTLNLPFHELVDPRASARDVTGLSRWGNGDAELFLHSEDELPYLLGLIRQSLERQLGNSSDS